MMQASRPTQEVFPGVLTRRAPDPHTVNMQLLVGLTAGLASVGLGLLVMFRGGQRRIGGLLVAHGVTLGAFLSIPEHPSTTRSGLVTDQLTQGTWVFLFLWLVLIAYLLPTGHTGTRWWRLWVRIGLAGVVLFHVGAAGDRTAFMEGHDSAPPPLPWLPEVVSGVLGLVGLLLVVLLVLGSFVSLWLRLRAASGEDRVRLLWPVWGSLSVPAVLAFGWANHFLLGDHELPFAVALVLLGVGLPATIAISVLRHRLFDIELVLSRTLTYAALTILVVGAYAGLLTLADHIFGNRSAGGLVAVGLVAVLVHPTYSWLRRSIERLVYGYRSDPAVALRRLGASVESSDPLRVVDAITRSVAEALKVDDVWVELKGESPRDEAHVVRLPLVHSGERLAELAVRVPPHRSLSPADEALLQDLARQAAVVVKAGQLAAELQESRSRIVSAREEERKRLRRDLHDGVGPSLAAIVLKLDVARGRADETDRNSLLDETREEAKETIKEVRRLVDDLRPPAIDEVGLVGALRQRAAALSTDALGYEVTGPDALPVLPAAVEVAAFRIASEAMTNTAKHSGASRCVVEVELDETLSITVVDNGLGAARLSGTGVGWTSMTERAAELGGSCTISSRAEGGLVVRALLPLNATLDDVADMEVVP
jgi:two-component system, NarL family, sensor kinase